jgi:UDP-N-acetylmuramoyl-tripeptide--D-alanyl-D-alanine ligase
MLFRNLLLAFQLEQYQPSRFLKFSYTHWQFRYKGSKRQTLDWTKKAMLLFGVSIGILVVGGWLFSLWILQGSGGDGLFIGERIEGIGAIFLLLLMYPLVLVVASFIIFPLEFLLKHRIITQAKRKIQQFPQLVIIGITGSYGKTSVKEILKAMLEPSMQVIATP